MTTTKSEARVLRAIDLLDEYRRAESWWCLLALGES